MLPTTHSLPLPFLSPPLTPRHFSLCFLSAHAFLAHPQLSCIAWIPKGAPAKNPQPYELPPEALTELNEGMKNTNISGPTKDSNKLSSSSGASAKKDGKKDKKGAAVKSDKNNNNDDKTGSSKKKAAAKAMDDSEGDDSADNNDDDDLGSDIETGGKDEDLMKALGMDNYDDDDDGDDADADTADASAMLDSNNNNDDDEEDAYEGDDDEDEDEEEAQFGGSVGRFLGSGLKGYIPPEDDPYMNSDDDDEEEDEEENHIKSTDSCILVGNTSEEQSVVEIYVYDEENSNLYVHHELNVPSFPLALTWLPTHPRGGQPSAVPGELYPTTGSFAAVGTFLPGIEIWNCDVLNPVEPVCVLGGYVEQDPLSAGAGAAPRPSTMGKGSKGAAGKKKQPTLKPGSHTDAVMCLAWHRAEAARLASGSADTTIKLWDITTQQCTATLRSHKDKVQAIEFNPTEYHILLSGAYDKTVKVQDVRLATSGSTGSAAATFKVTADIESVKWDPHSAVNFYAATEDGLVVYRDIRNQSKPVWQLHAHKKTTTVVAPNAVVAGLFATASVDGTVKIWDMNGNASTDASASATAAAAASKTSKTTTTTVGGSNAPKCLGERNLQVGHLMCMAFDASSPFVLAAGGEGGSLAIWDTLENIGVNERYGKAAEAMGLGPQTLPSEYIQMQKEGGQSKGMGPGREGTGRNAMRNGGGAAADSDSDDSDEEEGGRYERMAMHKPVAAGDSSDDDDE